jgi:UDP-N-acetylglucosamine 2-epimerase (non-hydrolysing)
MHDPSREKLRVMVIYGTRPEAIKLAPVVHRLIESPQVELVQLSTGQHSEMLEQVTDYFAIQPDIRLDVMRPNQSLSGLTARLLEQLDAAVEQAAPSMLVVQGDTTTALVGSLVAFYRRLPLVHVEAGLRTGDLQAPWPEELNRRITSLVTTIHCAPTTRAAENLLREGISPSAIHVTGNTVVDALLWTIERERHRSREWLAEYPMAARPMVLITAHRRESFGQGMQQICRAIARLADRFPEMGFVYPVHLNPHVQRPVKALLGSLPNVHLVPPASYPAFVWLMDRSRLVLSDSGGVQEEAPSLGKPVIVMRDTTERQEAVEAGAVELVGTDTGRIVETVARVLTDGRTYRRMQVATNPFGDGRAAQRIVEIMLASAEIGSRKGSGAEAAR